MQAEKRIYQLELMNRETNYNKIFSANPHVGVLDPLQFKVGGMHTCTINIPPSLWGVGGFLCLFLTLLVSPCFHIVAYTVVLF